MYRKLAVPLVVKGAENLSAGRVMRCRTLRSSAYASEDLVMLSKLADNRERIERLERDVHLCPEAIDCSDIVNELDYLKTSMGIGLAEISVEIEDVPASEEILEEAIIA